MKNYIVTIKHVTGSYELIVPENLKDDLINNIMKCINNEQTCFTNTSENGDLSIYPAEFLKESFISMQVHEGLRSRTVYEAEWQ